MSCERAFAHLPNRGGIRRTWKRGRENVAKRYRVHVAAHNLGLVVRALIGAGTPRATADLRLLGLMAGDRLLLVLLVASPACSAALAVVTVTPDNPALSTGC